MKKIAVLIGIVLTFVHCTNDTPLPNGYELLDRENKVGLAAPLTFKPTKTAHYWKIIPAGAKSSLMLGVGKDMQSFVIFQCRNLIKVPVQDDVLAAKLSMYSVGTVGDKNPFTLSAHRYDQYWSENNILWKDVENSYQPEPLETWQFTPQDTTWHSFQFTNLQFIKEWIADSHQEEQSITGLLLKFDQASSGAIFVSSESSITPPYIEVISQDTSGVIDTTIAYLSHDASLLQNKTGIDEDVVEQEPAVLKVGNGTGYRGLLHFDVSEIPADATIHQALLTFYIAHSEVFMPADSASSTFSVAARLIESDSTWSIDSTYSAAIDVANSSKNTFAFDSTTPVKTMSYMVQRWVSNVSPNYGIMVYAKDQSSDFYEMAFKSGAMDSVVAPTLVITYSLPAAHRFARP
ncbi:DNRLRE domain-containing protein [candidate division KSB1 bacterium]|nr:DNRLRE domain-containing protein [candidate division KSB1 bacterium]RQW05819.1 MAG: DNRLRE domain-containing protein [candidate division KSB1 bacterium]